MASNTGSVVRATGFHTHLLLCATTHLLPGEKKTQIVCLLNMHALQAFH